MCSNTGIIIRCFIYWFISIRYQPVAGAAFLEIIFKVVDGRGAKINSCVGFGENKFLKMLLEEELLRLDLCRERI